MCRFALIFFILLSSIHSAIAGEYRGNSILEILGENKVGSEVNKFKSQFILDKALKNPELGIKLIASHDSGSVVTAVIFTAPGCEMNDIKYKQFAGILPFNISFIDDEETLVQKLGTSKGGDENKVRFKKDGITINVYYKSSSKKKINYVKYSQSIGAIGPYRVDGPHSSFFAPAVAVAEPEHIKDNGKPVAKNGSLKPSAPDKSLGSLPTPAEFGKSTAATRVSEEPFYAAIMNVIESGEEEMFKTIKREPTPKSNFWNYKYTFTTTIAIPGEKYNMLYSFPFQNSQLDFVSVLEESDGESAGINAKYTEVEAKLKSYFKTTEGWSYHYTANQEDPKGIKDFELKNPRLGSIVLDHSINPYGKHVLYLRFLLQYT